MTRKIFYVANFLLVFCFLNFSGCLSFRNSDSNSYVGTSIINYSVEQGTVSNSAESYSNLFWYDPFGTISSSLRDGRVCEIEISMGYNSTDRDFLIQFAKNRNNIFNSIIKYVSKNNSKIFIMDNADEIESDLLSVINNECKGFCHISKVKIIRLEIF